MRFSLAGFVLIILGILLFLSNFGLFTFNWDAILRLWPLLLIFFGIKILIGHQSSGVAIIAFSLIVIAAIILSGGITVSNSSLQTGQWSMSTASKQDLSEDYESSLDQVSLNMDGGAGSFVINNTSEKLIEVNTESNSGHYSLKRRDHNDDTTIDLKFDQDRSFLSGGHKNNVTIALNSNPLWTMDFNVGASSVDFDLSPYAVEKLSLDSGATSLKIKLGEKADTSEVDLNVGASSVNLLVPKDVGCEIKATTALSSKDFKGFNKIDDKTYRSDGYDSFNKKISIDIDAGVSSLDVTRY